MGYDQRLESSGPRQLSMTELCHDMMQDDDVVRTLSSMYNQVSLDCTDKERWFLFYVDL